MNPKFYHALKSFPTEIYCVSRPNAIVLCLSMFGWTQNVVKILGLKFNHEYQDTKSLRYGHLMIMTDQDHDGSHIKGERCVDCLVFPSILPIAVFVFVSEKSMKPYLTPLGNT